MTDTDVIVLRVVVTVLAVLIVGSLIFKRAQGGKFKGSVAAAVLLVALGLYFFPLGAIEAYDGTRHVFGWDENVNSIVWYVATTAAIVAGAASLARKKQ